MKIFIIILLLHWYHVQDEKLFIINDILYKMPDKEIKKIKDEYCIKGSDIIIYKFDIDSCDVPLVEAVRIVDVKAELNDPFKSFRIKNTPIFICEGMFVNMEYINLNDIESIMYVPKEEAIQKYGCKGLNPIFKVKLKKGKKIQNEKVDGINIL